MKRSGTILFIFFVLTNFAFAQWNTQTVDNSGDVGKWSDIAYDSQGYPHIVYFDDTDDDIMYAWWDGTAWHYEEISPAGWSSFKGCSIALDNQDHPHVALNVTNYNQIEYWEKTSGSWNYVVIERAGGAGGYPDICLYYNSSTGNTIPHIVYYKWYGLDEKVLRHAYYDNNTNQWIKETIDAANDVGIWPHIVSDASGHLYVSYYDQGAGALRFAYYNGTQWSTAVIDDVGDVGRYNSIALDATGTPCISYYDATNGDLKYVRITNVTARLNQPPQKAASVQNVNQ